MTSKEDTAIFAAKVATDQAVTGILKGVCLFQHSTGSDNFQYEETTDPPKKWLLSSNVAMVSNSRWNGWAQLKTYTRRWSQLANRTWGSGIMAWFALQLFTINCSTLLRGSDNERYPDLKTKDLEGFCRQHRLEQIPTLFR